MPASTFATVQELTLLRHISLPSFAHTFRGLSAALVLFSLLGCGALTARLPQSVSYEERIANIPTSGSERSAAIHLHFDEWQNPYVVAESDDDAAFGLGVVHAHLRLGQMELFRRVSQARISEIAGPFASDIDYTLRILNPDKAVAEIEKSLPESSKRWLEEYVAGINYFLRAAPELPKEFQIFNIKREPWAVRDVLAIARLAGTEVNWLFWTQMLRLYSEPEFEEFFSRVKEFGADSRQSFESITSVIPLAGSNSFAVSGKRTGSGAAMMASDPHVGIALPNLWVAVGIRSPSYQSLGITLPGLPLILIGRNTDISWGATNMMGLSSALYKLDKEQLDKAKKRTETIKQRWWFSKTVTIRESEFGPVLSDSPFFTEKGLPPFAIRWRGHEVSDEITPFLEVMKAKNFQQFRKAFRSYAVSAQNYLYADKRGNIGHVLAHEFPVAAGRAAPELLADPSEPAFVDPTLIPSTELPHEYNPGRGYVVSTNNRPVPTDPPLTYFAHSNARYERIGARLRGNAELKIDDLKAMQLDVTDPSSGGLASRISKMLAAEGDVLTRNEAESELLEALQGWDGTYDVESKGALAYQLILHGFIERYYGAKYGENISSYLKSSQITNFFLEQDLGELGTLAPLRIAFWKAVEPFEAYQTWGAFHRVELNHPLANAPLIGSRFKFGEYPASGSSGTVLKTAHSVTDEKHATRFGANSRFVTDLSEIDSNFMVLLGGQDGWFGSKNFNDQVTLWRSGEYAQFPLSMPKIRELFKKQIQIQ